MGHVEAARIVQHPVIVGGNRTRAEARDVGPDATILGEQEDAIQFGLARQCQVDSSTLPDLGRWQVL